MPRGKDKRKHVRRTNLSAYERLQWARRQWMEDSTIPIQGSRGMIRLMKSQFGVAAAIGVLHDLRKGVLDDISHLDAAKQEADELKTTRLAEKNKKLFKSTLSALKAKHAAFPETPEAPSAVIPTSDAPGVTVSGPEIVPAPRKRAKASSFHDREVFAMQQLKIRPHMSLGGKDGLNALLRSRFGKGMAFESLRQLKAQVQGEMDEPETLKSIMSAKPSPSRPEEKPATEPTLMVHPKPPAATEAVTDKHLIEAFKAVGEMLLESIPNLKSYSLTVDENGKRTVKFTKHQMIIQSGEITLD